MALEEKEALEKVERTRMLGQNETDSEEEGAVKGKRKSLRGADDLDFDDFDEGTDPSGEWSGLRSDQ